MDLLFLEKALISLFVTIIVAIVVSKLRGKRYKLPPGPIPVPVFGNWLQVGDDLNHRNLTDLAKKFGDIFLLRMGQRNLVVVSSPELAKEVLHTQGVEFGSRTRNVVFDIFTGKGQDMVFTVYGEHWRKMRRIMTVPFFTNKVVQQYRHGWEAEVAAVVEDVKKNPESATNGIVLRKRLQLMMYNNMYRIMFDRRFESEDDPLFVKLKALNGERSRLAQSFDYNYGDFIPILRPFLRGYLKLCKEVKEMRLQLFRDHFLEERKKLSSTKRPDNNALKCAIDHILDAQQKGEINEDNVLYIVENINVAGTFGCKIEPSTHANLNQWTSSQIVPIPGVVGGSGAGVKDLPYNIGDPYPSAWGSWSHFRGTSKDDGSPVSIFSLTGSNPQDGHLAAGRNGVKRLRTVRHPNILSFLHSTEVESFDGSSTKVTIYIVTEPVMPLSEKIKELGLEGTQRDEYYAWGLHQIAKAVSFLNNDCKLVHGNVCLSSVVVTPTLDWKLHAFDVLSEYDGSNESATGPMLQYEWLVGLQYKPMEMAKSDWAAIRKSPPWAIDSWGLGCLIYEIFSGMKLSRTEELRNTASIPKSLLPDYQRLLSSMPSRRLNTSKLLENSEYFQNKLVDTIHFMEILSLKDSVEKDTFFRKLPNLAEQLPRQIVLKKLLPLLASSLEFGSAAAPALTALLKMGSWLSAEEFSLKVLPTIVKLFASNDRAIRVALLQHIDQFGESLAAQIVDEQVYPHVSTGFADTSAFLRELTLKSMLVLAPKLSQRTLSGSLLKYLSKLQVDEEPAIRTNTTILLGNIASYLNEGTRKRVLINAFTVRALRDTFSPARAAGVMALCATSSYYDVTEIATRILPNIVVLTIDPDSDVRSKAFQAVEQFLQIVKQYNEKINAGDTAGAASLGISSIPGNASLLGWAMSSLTLKNKPSDQAPVATANNVTAATTTTSTASSGLVETPSTAPVHRVSSSTDFTDQPPSPTSTDGWGEMENGIHDEHDSDKDGWDDIEPLEDPKPSPALANIQAAQKRPVSQPVSQPKPQATSLRPKSTVKVAKDEDDELWGSIAAAPPKTASKPLNLKAAAPVDDDDPWAAIAAPAPTTKAKPLSAGRGRGAKPAVPKLGAQRINRTSSSGM
ncbi:Cytochrome P450 [Corchorus capsularis]|uniref:Cytochrome P450 n=2 Tax=Magnoliopsida TaxID=3398 RepID=A0A1R3GZW6_COCAP|nr:Cytochrome P450 [Corchorus capsularis]